MRTQATHILISFCNTTPGAPSLALFEIANGVVRILSTPPQLAAQKATGFAMSERFLIVVTSRIDPSSRPSIDPPNPSGLFIFDRQTLSLLTSHACTSIFDAHSVVVAENTLFVVSTGSDEVVRVDLTGSEIVREEVVWRPDPHGTRADLHHLNAICRWDGELVVSGFGRKSGPAWSSASYGFIIGLRSGRGLASDVKHPHSLLDTGAGLVYCESSTSTVRLLGSDRVQQLPGYPRGLAIVGEHLYVGTSRGRRISKSTGLLTNRGDPGAPSGCCAIVRLNANTLDIEEAVDLDRFGAEIYDLLPVSGVERWPIQGETEWRDKLIAGLWHSYEERDAHVAWLHTEVSERDATVEWLHWEVAERDRSVRWLHEEVAERDRLVEELRAVARPVSEDEPSARPSQEITPEAT